jgi:N5-(carboxyethyl)ornithine synthase
MPQNGLMEKLTLGVIGTSRKENEHRVPIHPDHLRAIDPALLGRLVFERGYGEPFGIPDEEFGAVGCSLAGREEILATVGVALLPKPLPADLREVREGGVLWGWPHCVQQREITQVAIDRRLTLLAWEAMFQWKRGGVRDMHTFYRNNEMAGYAGVIHALGLAGLDGYYGAPARAAVLSFGSVSRGAIAALRGRGFEDITVYTQRPSWAVHNAILGCRHLQMVSDRNGVQVIDEDGSRRPLVDDLVEMKVIVNGILQDTEHPLMFLDEGDLARMNPGGLIVDISCDEGMGFPFARPTSFEQPTFEVGHLTYYAVDHSPSYLWRSASWELSRAVLPYLETVLGGPEAWAREETIERAIEIREGRVINENILSFQGREAAYPHLVRD